MAHSVDSKETSSFLNRPAIIWQRSKAYEEHDGHSKDGDQRAFHRGCYWNVSTPYLPSNPSENYVEGNEDNGERHTTAATIEDITANSSVSITNNITYEELIIGAARLAMSLRIKISQKLQQFFSCGSLMPSSVIINGIQSKSIGIPIVVAIPEGPLLPLTILAVHCLNQPFPACHADDDEPIYGHAVLIPIEPSQDGQQRIANMIQDSKPLCILTVSETKDFDTLRCILNDLKGASFSASSLSSSPSSSWSSSSLFGMGTLDIGHTPELLTIDTLFDPRNVMPDTVSPIRFAMLACLEDNPDLSVVKLIVTTMDSFEFPFTVRTPTTVAIATNMHSANRLSHVVFTSGTTGRPKGCMSSSQALRNYIRSKNVAHFVTSSSTVLLASSLSFDPCFSDVLATFACRATLAIAPRAELVEHLGRSLKQLTVTHLLCTPTLFQLVREMPSAFPSMQVLALGGEPIPASLQRSWGDDTVSSCKLFATYGVTEACVYQVMGQVVHTPNHIPHSRAPGSEHTASDSDSTDGDNAKISGRQQDASPPRSCVGLPFGGMQLRICKENKQHGLEDTSGGDVAGEIVLFGNQIDEHSGYLLPDNSSPSKFVKGSFIDISIGAEKEAYFYRTGDKGYVDKVGNLHVMGRIEGEQGMIKVNGIRMELGEIESAVEDWGTRRMPSIVKQCIVTARLNADGRSDDGSKIELVAYIVLAESCLQYAGLPTTSQEPQPTRQGSIILPGPLLVLLRQACTSRITPACVPSVFVAIPSIPLSPTGKKDPKQLPQLEECNAMDPLVHNSNATPLSEHGLAGKIVAKHIIECLNLQPNQRSMLTSSASFSMLGGDSLAATRVTRALYAAHHNVNNSRHLGGEFGTFDGPFNALHLVRAANLGDYVDMLDENRICRQEQRAEGMSGVTCHPTETSIFPTPWKDGDPHQTRMYDALLQACTTDQTDIAIGLLHFGADPNHGAHNGRLGKTSDRLKQKSTFRSSPLHLAASKGDHVLVAELLAFFAKLNTPDASGLFPIHLAAAGKPQPRCFEKYSPVTNNSDHCRDQGTDIHRLECVKALLKNGAPLATKDANRQTVLHSAARAGHCRVIQHLMKTWRTLNYDEGVVKVPVSHYFNWTDRWFRTPVHWAILNGHIGALAVLLDFGCHANPPRPKMNFNSSAAVESPLEMCDRLYGRSTEMGSRIRSLLAMYS